MFRYYFIPTFFLGRFVALAHELLEGVAGYATLLDKSSQYYLFHVFVIDIGISQQIIIFLKAVGY